MKVASNLLIVTSEYNYHSAAKPSTKYKVLIFYIAQSHKLTEKKHVEDGTQRFELPVSKTTLNFWGGVPMPISP